MSVVDGQGVWTKVGRLPMLGILRRREPNTSSPHRDSVLTTVRQLLVSCSKGRKDMVRFWALLAITQLLIGCVSPQQLQTAVDAVDAEWKRANDAFMKTSGTREIEATPTQALVTSRNTLHAIGMFVENESAASGIVFASSRAPTPLSSQQWARVVASDEPWAIRITKSHLGMIGWFARLNPEPYDIVSNVSVSPVKGKSNHVSVVLRFQLRDRMPPPPNMRRGTEPPPTAVALGIGKFWSEFDRQLESLKTEKGGDQKGPGSTSDKKIASLKNDRPAALVATGTGFFVSTAGHIVTNNHVINDCDQVKVRNDNGKVDYAVPIGSDDKNDLALLKLNGKGYKWATFRGSEPLRLGEEIVTIGYPYYGVLSNTPSVTTGNVTAMAGLLNDTKMIQISAPVQQGNSGGPVIDRSGNVVGVVTSKLNALRVAKLTGDIPQNVNFSIKSALVTSFLDAFQIDYHKAPSSAELKVVDIASNVKASVVLVECWSQ